MTLVVALFVVMNEEWDVLCVSLLFVFSFPFFKFNLIREKKNMSIFSELWKWKLPLYMGKNVGNIIEGEKTESQTSSLM